MKNSKLCRKVSEVNGTKEEYNKKGQKQKKTIFNLFNFNNKKTLQNVEQNRPIERHSYNQEIIKRNNEITRHEILSLEEKNSKLMKENESQKSTNHSLNITSIELNNKLERVQNVFSIKEKQAMILKSELSLLNETINKYKKNIEEKKEDKTILNLEKNRLLKEIASKENREKNIYNNLEKLEKEIESRRMEVASFEIELRDKIFFEDEAKEKECQIKKNLTISVEERKFLKIKYDDIVEKIKHIQENIRALDIERDNINIQINQNEERVVNEENIKQELLNKLKKIENKLEASQVEIEKKREKYETLKNENLQLINSVEKKEELTIKNSNKIVILEEEYSLLVEKNENLKKEKEGIVSDTKKMHLKLKKENSKYLELKDRNEELEIVHQEHIAKKDLAFERTREDKKQNRIIEEYNFELKKKIDIKLKECHKLDLDVEEESLRKDDLDVMKLALVDELKTMDGFLIKNEISFKEMSVVLEDIEKENFEMEEKIRNHYKEHCIVNKKNISLNKEINQKRIENADLTKELESIDISLKSTEVEASKAELTKLEELQSSLKKSIKDSRMNQVQSNEELLSLESEITIKKNNIRKMKDRISSLNQITVKQTQENKELQQLQTSLDSKQQLLNVREGFLVGAVEEKIKNIENTKERLVSLEEVDVGKVLDEMMNQVVPPPYPSKYKRVV